MEFIRTEYTNYNGDSFRISIIDPNYTGDINEVQGKATLERPKVKLMDVVRGSSLEIQLESELDVNSSLFEALVESVGDKNITVDFYKNGVKIWSGFLKQDGITENFTQDYWIINLKAIDGLGYLKNIEYLDEDGNQYQDNVSELEQITRCLQLTGQSLNFKIYYFNLFFTVDDSNPTFLQKAIYDTEVNTSRYVEDDQERSVFTAKDVLDSILKKYGAFICQQDNKWHIVRITEFYSGITDTKTYNEYDSNGALILNEATENVATILGSDINGFDPCHASTNQRKQISGALGAYKVVYEYGFVQSILENSRLYWTDTSTIDGWTPVNLAFFDFVLQDAIPTFPSGYYIGRFEAIERSVIFDFFEVNIAIEAISSDISAFNEVEQGEVLLIDISGRAEQRNKDLSQYAFVKLEGDSGNTYYLSDNGNWSLSADNLVKVFNKNINSFIVNNGQPSIKYPFNRKITTSTIPENGNISIVFARPTFVRAAFAPSLDNFVTIENVNITGSADANVQGESYTARKTDNATTKVELEDELKVGDNNSDIYIGAIENASEENTLAWCKSVGGVIDTTKKYRLLEWLVRDRLTLSSGNSIKFTGDILGYLPYLGSLTIDGLTGEYMTTSWSYDTVNNVISAEHIRIFNDDISDDVEVEFSLESENVIEPAIE